MTGTIRNLRQKLHPRSVVFSKSANPLDLLQKSTVHALFKAKSVDPKTYSPPSFVKFFDYIDDTDYVITSPDYIDYVDYIEHAITKLITKQSAE